MTASPVPAGIRLDADLTVSVDGQVARVHADGRSVRVESERPRRFLWAATRALPGGSGGLRSRLTPVVRALTDSGITVTVAGPRRTVLRTGAGVDSGSGRLFLRSPGVAVAGASRALAAGLALVAGAVLAGILARARRADRDPAGSDS